MKFSLPLPPREPATEEAPHLRAVIFDLDGTLLDSMGFWEELAPAFLRRHGAPETPGIVEEIAVLTLPKAISRIIRRFGLPLTEDEALAEIDRELTVFYGERAQFKPGAREAVGELRKRGIPLGILSATRRQYVESALRRLGALEEFALIRHTGEAGMSKTGPEGFREMARQLGSLPAETLVCEDALYAATSAKQAGCLLCAIRDPSEDRQRELRELADWYLADWNGFPFRRFD